MQQQIPPLLAQKQAEYEQQLAALLTESKMNWYRLKSMPKGDHKTPDTRLYWWNKAKLEIDRLPENYKQALEIRQKANPDAVEITRKWMIGGRYLYRFTVHGFEAELDVTIYEDTQKDDRAYFDIFNSIDGLMYRRKLQDPFSL